MILRLVPLIVGLLPILTVNLCYLIAVDAGTVPECIPFIEGCVSVSATGRYPPASYLFRAVMLPNAIFLMLYWLLCVAWLRALGRAVGARARSGSGIGVLGITGALCLILYVTFLGSQEPLYEFMRRFGVYLYFAFSIIAQLLLGFMVLPLARAAQNAALERITKAQLVLALVPFALGILNLALKATLDNPDPPENIIEWIFALLMQCYFVLSYFSWRGTAFSVALSVRADAGR